jgi:hypothetical protein
MAYDFASSKIPSNPWATAKNQIVRYEAKGPTNVAPGITLIQASCKGTILQQKKRNEIKTFLERAVYFTD